MCNTTVCNSSSSSLRTCNDTASNVFQAAEETGDYLCCSVTVAALVGILIAVLVVVGVFIGIIVWKYKKAAAEFKEAKYQEREKKMKGLGRLESLKPENPYGNPYAKPNENT